MKNEPVPEVNVENVRLLAEFVKSEKYKFNMVSALVIPGCGSAGCIGGHAAVLWPELRHGMPGETVDYTFEDKALANKLGLSIVAEEELCYPSGMGLRTREEAVVVLFNLAETGKVEWPAVKAEESKQ